MTVRWGIVACAVLTWFVVGCGARNKVEAPPGDPSPVPPHDEAATRGGDGAPHNAENRAGVLPDSLPPAVEARLRGEAAELAPVLEAVRGTNDITAASVERALVAAGYAADRVEALPRTSSLDGTEYVVYGVSFDDGCVSGMVTPGEVQALPTGRYPEWGCIPPDTH